ncbi:MAG: DUF4097 domain-containing protein [Anaerolineae bacterium]|nr:DUF4097 domain-containing protein [Anaerolineae bacterium]
MNEKFEIIEKSFEVDSSPTLDVQNISGHVTLQTGAPGVISITAKKYLNRGNPELTEIHLTQDKNGAVHARTKFTPGLLGIGRQAAKVDYDITLPEHCDIRAELVESRLDIAGISGKIVLNSVSGEINAANIQDDIRIKTVSGNISADRLAGKADFDTVSANITVNNSLISWLNANSVSGNIAIETGLDQGPYSFKSVSGKLSIILPQDCGCSISAASLSGEIRTNITATRLTSKPPKHFFELEGGGPAVIFNTVSGNMFVLTKDGGESRRPSTGNEKIRKVRLGILTQLENGELSVEDALEKLS